MGHDRVRAELRVTGDCRRAKPALRSRTLSRRHQADSTRSRSPPGAQPSRWPLQSRSGGPARNRRRRGCRDHCRRAGARARARVAAVEAEAVVAESRVAEVAADEPEAVVAEPEVEVAADEPEASASEQAELPVDEDWSGRQKPGQRRFPRLPSPANRPTPSRMRKRSRTPSNRRISRPRRTCMPGTKLRSRRKRSRTLSRSRPPHPIGPPAPERQMPGSDQPQTSTNEPRAADRLAADHRRSRGRLRTSGRVHRAARSCPSRPLPPRCPRIRSRWRDEAHARIGRRGADVAGRGIRGGRPGGCCPGLAQSGRCTVRPGRARRPSWNCRTRSLRRLAEDEGWDADEVEAIRRLLGRPSDALAREPISPATPRPLPVRKHPRRLREHPARPWMRSAVGPPPAAFERPTSPARHPGAVVAAARGQMRPALALTSPRS